MCYFKKNCVTETKAETIEYLSTAFKGLSIERKDYVLETARSLLEIQGDSNYPAKTENTTTMQTLSDISQRRKLRS